MGLNMNYIVIPACVFDLVNLMLIPSCYWLIKTNGLCSVDHWLILWYAYKMIGWFYDMPTRWFVDFIICVHDDWLIVWYGYKMIGWLYDMLNRWLVDFLICSLCGCFVVGGWRVWHRDEFHHSGAPEHHSHVTSLLQLFSDTTGTHTS